MRIIRCKELDDLTPLDVLARWPAHAPIASLTTHPTAKDGISVLGMPSGRLDLSETSGQWLGPDDSEWTAVASQGVMAALDAVDALRADLILPSNTPLYAGWIVCLHYEFGRLLEPSVGPMPEGTLVSLIRCHDAYVLDHANGHWYRCGTPPNLTSAPPPRAPMLQESEVTSTPAASVWPTRVARAVEYIHAGDIFQVNLCRTLSMHVQGSARNFAAHALRDPQTRFGALIEFPDQNQTIVSLSPELFLEVTHEGLIRTCPIKGTLPADQPAEVLRQSSKDAAELHMIVDLMRNDLGRVCEIGTVDVTSSRRIESHATVHHGVGEVRGQLRQDAKLTDILSATFPPGSITGAPKIRAMQIAAELENGPRGIYCGAIGLLGPGRHMTLSVAIRTAVIQDNELRYGVGCGIVADSQPEAELAESWAKATVLMAALSPPCAATTGAAASPQSPS